MSKLNQSMNEPVNVELTVNECRILGIAAMEKFLDWYKPDTHAWADIDENLIAIGKMFSPLSEKVKPEKDYSDYEGRREKTTPPSRKEQSNG